MAHVAPRPVVGNDVVDLTRPRTAEMATDRRFLDRVFSASERAAIARADDPRHAVWTRWAAKETAFKAVSKTLADPPVFEHAAFETEWRGPDGGSVRYGSDVVEVRLDRIESGLVHVVGWLGAGAAEPAGFAAAVHAIDEPRAAWAVDIDELSDRLTPRELEAVHTPGSAAVRVAARMELAAMLGVDVARLEIVSDSGRRGRMPPWVLLDGEPAPADVSLSHDGRWIAWAVCARAPRA